MLVRVYLGIAIVGIVATAVLELLPRAVSSRTECLGTDTSVADLRYSGPMLVGPTMQALLVRPDRVGFVAGQGQCVGRERYRVDEITDHHVSLSAGTRQRIRLVSAVRY